MVAELLRRLLRETRVTSERARVLQICCLYSKRSSNPLLFTLWCNDFEYGMTEDGRRIFAFQYSFLDISYSPFILCCQNARVSSSVMYSIICEWERDVQRCEKLCLHVWNFPPQCSQATWPAHAHPISQFWKVEAQFSVLHRNNFTPLCKPWNRNPDLEVLFFPHLMLCFPPILAGV